MELRSGECNTYPASVSGKKGIQLWTLVATSLGFGVVQLDVTVVNVAVHRIGSDLGGNVSALQWVVNAYTLMFASLILLAGALGDRFGARRVFETGFVVFVLASILCGLAPDMTALIAGRAVEGIGAAMLGACSLALLNRTFVEPDRRRRAIGFWAAGASTALSAGPVVGGILIATIGWRGIFFINVPIGAAGLWLTARNAQETSLTVQRQLDIPGAVAAVVALAGFSAAIIRAGSDGFSDLVVIGGLTVALLGGAAFTIIERRSSDPVIPPGLLSRPDFILPTTMGFLVNICFYGLIFVFSLLWQADRHFSALDTGLAFLPMTGAILGANLVSSPVSRVIGNPWTILCGICAMAAGASLLRGIGPSSSYLSVVGQQVLLGGGIGLLVPPLTNVVLGSVRPSQSGVVSGALTAARQAGSLLGVAVFGSLVARRSFYGGTHLALAVTVALLVAGAAVGIRLTR